MKNRIDQLVDEAFMDELLQLAPVPVDQQKLKENVFRRLNLEIPAPKVTALPVSKPKRRTPRFLLIAAVLVAVTAMGVVAYNEWLKLSDNKVDYFTAAENSSQSDAAAQNEDKTTSHDTDSPVFFQGLDAAVEKLNTPVGQSITHQGITITLDTVAADSNFVNLYFTATYDKPIVFDSEPGEPDYAILIYRFMPIFFMNINSKVDLDNGNYFHPDGTDGYFVDDQTIRFSMMYYLPETYPEQFTIYALGYHAIDADGNDLLGQAVAATDENPFRFQTPVDKSEENLYCRSAAPGKYVFNTQRGEGTLYLNKLMISPLGATMGCTVNEYEEDGSPRDAIGLDSSSLFMEDDKGNVIDFYSDFVMDIGSYRTKELINLSPEAQSITIMPLYYHYDEQSYERRQYNVDGIEGEKIEISNIGGFIVQSYTVKGSSVEFELEPYGRVFGFNSTDEFRLDDENLPIAGGNGASIRQQYNRETGIYTYAVDYYAATEEELKAIECFYVDYKGSYEIDRDEAITLPLEAVNP